MTSVTGRKNFAISFCGDQIFVTGGMDNGLNLLSEFLIFRPGDGMWQEMRPKKKNKNPIVVTKRERRNSRGRHTDLNKKTDLGLEYRSMTQKTGSGSN